MTSRKRKLNQQSGCSAAPLPSLSKELLAQYQQYLETHIEFYPHEDFSFLDEEQAFRELCASLNLDIYNLSTTFEEILSKKHSLDLSVLEKARLAYANPSIDLLPPGTPIVCSAESCSPSIYDSFSGNNFTNRQSNDESSPQTPSSISAATMHSFVLDGSDPFDNFPPIPPVISPSFRYLIVSDDVRFKLPRVMTKTLNTMGDKAKFRSILTKYFLPTARNRHKPQPFNFNPIGPKHYMEMLGIDAIAAYYDAVAFSIPDLVYDVQDVHWKFIRDGSCAVILSFIMQGTKVFHTSVETYDSVIIGHDGNALYSASSSTVNQSRMTSDVPASHSTSTNVISSPADQHSMDIDANLVNTHPADRNDKEEAQQIANIALQPTDDTAPRNSSFSNTAENHASSSISLPSSLHSLDMSIDTVDDADPLNDTTDIDTLITGIEKVQLQGCMHEVVPLIIVGTMTFFTQPDGKVYDMDCVFHNRIQVPPP